MKLIYTACFYLNEDGQSYTVTVPDLPGCTTFGDNLEEALDMIIDAASGWVLVELEEGKHVPPATEMFNISLDDDLIVNSKAFKSLITLDMDEYAEKYGDKAVRKNTTIPAWLNTIAEKENINFSQVLQEALKKQLGY